LRPRLPLASAVVALVGVVAFAASAAAEPPTSPLRYDGPMSVVTLQVTPRPSVAPAPAASSAGPVGVLAIPGAPPVPTLAPRPQPAAALDVVIKPTPTPKPPPRQASSSGQGRSSTAVRSSGNSLRGKASWYCNNDGSRAQISACHYQYPDTGAFNAYAAAGPRLRAALGSGWRGRVVSVNGVRVKLVDWCQCYQGQSHEKVIDLYLDVFRRTGGDVTIRW
jgi:hypothetical protein